MRNWQSGQADENVILEGKMSITKRLAGSVAAVAASVGAAAVYLAMNDWFGAGDLYAMAVWSLPIGATVFWLLRFGVFGAETQVAVRFVAGVVAGLLIGLAWTLVASLFLGGWIMAFSFPVPFCWLFGSVVGFAVGMLLDQPQAWPASAALVLVSVFGLARGFDYARTPPPAAVLDLKAGATNEEVQRVWTEVLGVPHPSGQGHDLRPGLQGIARTGHSGNHVQLTVTFRKSVDETTIQVLLDSITASPLVERGHLLDPGERTGIGRSVEY